MSIRGWVATAVAAAAGLAVAGGCGEPPAEMPPPPTDPAALMATLADLAGGGEKRVGTDGGAWAGEYVRKRMAAIGLADVHTEAFRFPRHDVAAKQLAVTVDGAARAVAFDVFEASGAGHADGEVVWVGTATDAELAAVDLTGKVAMVDRARNYHRSTQYLNVAAKGAAAMLYASAAPDNKVQVGSVRRDFEALGPIPAITVGADDGAALEQALQAGKAVRAVVDVQAASTPAEGANVIGRIVGSDGAHQIVLGAHFDTWFAGSSDNGGGVAALLALAERRVKQAKPRYTLTFVAYDGEEVALYGGYHFLRRHHVESPEPILAVLNFEIPSAANSTQVALARSNVAPLDGALKEAGLGQIYPLYAALDLVPSLFGGIIPTDIQGIYRSGVPTATTACDSPYYHTDADTPDKVDTAMLAEAVDGFDDALALLLADDPPPFAAPDPKLWRATVAARARQAGQPLAVDVAVTDAAGAAQAGAPVRATLLVDDFFQAAIASATADQAGKATLTFDGAAADMGAGRRFVHVTAGPKWPLVEQVIALP